MGRGASQKPSPCPRESRRDLPYTIRLPDGRTLFVSVPGRWVTIDLDGERLLRPDAVRFLDRIRVLAMEMPGAPSPAFIITLREALGMTQARMGKALGVDKITVSRWERGAVRPGAESVAALEKLRREAAARGVVIESGPVAR